MERKKNKGIFVHLCTFVCALAMVFTLLPVMHANAAEEKVSKLVNIAGEAVPTVPSSEGGKGPEHLIDGDDTTLWVNNGATWPTTVELKLSAENTKKVKKVVVKFEKGHDNWSVDLKLSHALNGVTSDLIEDNRVEGHHFNDVYEYTFAEPLAMSHLFVTLDNPKDGAAAGQYWPAVAEIEVWAEDDTQNVELSNVAGTAAITSVGGDAGNKAALTDEDYNSLYVFNNGGMSGLPEGAWVEMDLDKEYDVYSLEAAFEHADPDNNGFQFTFDVFGKSSTDTEWQPLFVDQTATRLTDQNVKTMDLPAVKKLKSVRINIKSINSTGGDPWPALAEFKIMADANAGGVQDTESIAYNKPLHTNTNQQTVNKINDGNTKNVWSGERYPAYIDIDLEKNYNLDEIQVFTPADGYSQYSIYTSMNGRDFDKLAEKTSKDACPAAGEKFNAKKKEARFVRLYVEYQSTSSRALVNEVRVLGTESGTPVQPVPAVEVEDFQDSKYNVQVTAQDTIDEVNGIIERRLGKKYQNWFSFELADAANGYDYFDLSMRDGKVHVKGNNGVSLATGINHYLKYFCNVNISQVGDQVTMPKNIVALDTPVHKETKFPVRYSYNYCTLSYSMAFWGEQEWRNELDWLALNGVNVVLDATAQEEVWRRFLTELGYTHQEAKDFIAGPAYYAWAYMANLSGFGGPVHDSWFSERTELARKNHLIMQKLGMQPVLQGYCGMVPTDIKTKDPSADVIPQGQWCAFQRPSMLKTTGSSFADYAAKFYAVQKAVYGDVSHYYATDPFHEGGNTADMNPADISRIVLDDMLKADPDAVWIIQSWQGNPTTALLQGLGDKRNHALVLDLYAEKTPHWNETDPNQYGGGPNGGEFLNTPWVYCMLNNFGGRLGLHGHIDNFVNGIANASKNAKHMAGIGITPEASVNNPVLYDLFFETIWTDDANADLKAINVDQWLNDYAARRYGAVSKNAQDALHILHETVYNPALNMKGQGAPESVVNARPQLNIGAASTWGNAEIDYNKEDLERAAALLLKDYDKLKNSAGYQYDLANVLEQVLSNTAQEYQKKMTAAFNAHDAAKFTTMSDKFLEIIDLVERVTGTQKSFMLGTWVESAKALAANADDFTKDLYELNARSLITTWGSIDQANNGGLIDYSNRQWSGLTKDYYKPRWEKWIAERKKELAGEPFKNYTSGDWFEMEWAWARSNNTYPTEPNGEDLKKLGDLILGQYTVGTMPKDPAEDDKNDIAVDGITLTVGSEEGNHDNVEGPKEYVLDGKKNTYWHTRWSGEAVENLWIDLQLPEAQTVNGLRYFPRPGGENENGKIVKFDLLVKTADSNEYRLVVDDGTFSRFDWNMVTFEPIDNVTNIKLQAVETAGSSEGNRNLFMAAAELRVTHPAVVEPEPVPTPTVTPTAEPTSKPTVSPETSSKPEENKVDVKIVVNGNETVKTVDPSTKMKDVLPEVTVDSKHAFMGWFTKPNGKGTKIDLEQPVSAYVNKKAKANPTVSVYAYIKNASPMETITPASPVPTSKPTVTPTAEPTSKPTVSPETSSKPEENKVDVKIVINGNETVETVDLSTRMKDVLPEVTVDSKHAFMGWFTMPNGEGTKIDLEQPVSAYVNKKARTSPTVSAYAHIMNASDMETIKPAETTKPTTPETNKGDVQTGVYANPLVWVGVLAAAVVVAGAVFFVTKKKK